MQLLTEKRDFTRIRTHIPIQWQRISSEEHERWRDVFLQYATHERPRFFSSSPEMPSFAGDATRPAEVAILHSLKLLHQKMDRLLELLQRPQNAIHCISGESVDLSASGLRFLTDLEARQGEYLQLTLALPGDVQLSHTNRSLWMDQATSIEVLAKVVSVSRIAQRWEVAVTFSAIHLAEQQSIQRYCQQHRR